MIIQRARVDLRSRKQGIEMVDRAGWHVTWVLLVERIGFYEEEVAGIIMVYMAQGPECYDFSNTGTVRKLISNAKKIH